MTLEYFAGPIFTPEEFFLICLGAFLALGIIAGFTLFFTKKIWIKLRKPQEAREPRLLVFVLAGLALVAIAILIFLIIPTVVKDNRWKTKQQACAEKVGYASPVDDNNPSIATSASQSAYWNCLNSR